MSVRIEGLTAGYDDGTVLHDIRLEIGSGRICALIGRNGSGKTTLMRCINGFLKHSKGSISVSGRDISRLRRNDLAGLISLVPQGSCAPFMFSCIEMVLMGGATRVKPWSSPCAEEQRRALVVCRDVGIVDLADTPFNCLSGGQKQLVILARALHQDAPVMLLDEPNSHLDFPNQHRMMGLIRRVVKERGVTALITLHDPNLALYYSDDVVMLKEGRVVASGPTGEIMEDRHLMAVLGDNVMLDRTLSGNRVVVPRNVNGD
jgi:iron complex transport system ATP-binding protein